MDGACDVHRKEEKSVKGFGERTWGKETI
jgi:hypothetical protein